MISAGQADKIAAPKFAIDGASENPPARLLILPWGESSYDGGTAKLVVDGRSLALIPEAQRNSNFDKLALDFNHNSIPGSESYTGEPVKVAAYGLLEIVPNDGIYLANLEWTADGEKAWRGGYYRDISPAVLSDRHGVVYFVHSAALCRNGRIPGLEVFSADFLKPKTKATMDKYKQMVCRLLGVAEDTDDATIESAFERAVSEVGKKTDGGKNAETEKQLETFSARLDGISAAVDALSKRADEAARDALLSSALAEGKIVPESAKTLGLDALKTFCASLPCVVPLGRRTPEGIKEFSAKTPQNSAAAEVRNRLGLTEEEFEKGA